MLLGDVVFIENVEENKVKLTKCSSVDAMGWIPTTVINMLVTQSGATVGEVRKVLNK